MTDKPPAEKPAAPPRRKRVRFDTESGGGISGRKKAPVKVKHAKQRKHGSNEWLSRHLSDPYVQKAQIEGWRARAAFKLIEIQEKVRVIRKGDAVVDLGAAPGGWSQVALSLDAGEIVGIDLLPIEPLHGASFLQADFLDDETPQQLTDMLGRAPDVVLSDMAANTTGHRATDHLRTIALAEAAADFAVRVLAPGGTFVTKVFQGGTEGQLLTELKRAFKDVRHIKPPSSRAESAELFLVATGFRGRAQGEPDNT
jgi:23S rRNA (uridine2552-2'-O)-methyltransferase